MSLVAPGGSNFPGFGVAATDPFVAPRTHWVWEIQSIGVLHYWVDRDLAPEHKPDLRFATDVLLGAVTSVTGNPLPVPGKHCLSCPARACRPDELVPENALY
ncbi:MAG: hypothetical protein ABSH56_16490 [Bryobacteraceae bacterium]